METCDDCVCDVMEIFDGENAKAPVHRLCGSDSATLYSKTQNVLIKFSSDHSTCGLGFQAKITFIPREYHTFKLSSSLREVMCSKTKNIR